ncbi:MAG: flagellar basal body rod protein FlgC [Eubacteriales bacterium]|nr:flagellar basal body rod protein FlgC [Eubacteriales bacterium]
MSFLKSFDISGSALTAQRLRMDVIAENLANISTTRTAAGTPYRRRYVVMQEQGENTFSNIFERAMNDSNANGVAVTQVLEDESEFKLDYNPTHPDANEDGYVQMPNVDLVVEVVDMMSATRSYEANITAVNAFKSMAMKALEI